MLLVRVYNNKCFRATFSLFTTKHHAFRPWLRWESIGFGSSASRPSKIRRKNGGRGMARGTNTSTTVGALASTTERRRCSTRQVQCYSSLVDSRISFDFAHVDPRASHPVPRRMGLLLQRHPGGRGRHDPARTRAALPLVVRQELRDGDEEAREDRGPASHRAAAGLRVV